MIPESEKDNFFMPNVSNRNINDGIVMSGGSNIRGNLENINGNGSSLDAELELLLLQQQLHQGQRRNRDLLIQRERDLDIYRSGSAPPTVEGAFSAAGSILRSPEFGQFTDSHRGSGSDTNGVLTEEEIRSHPAYLAFYYSNENNNPRLPPPLLSKEDWRVAQRVGSSFGGIGDWRNKNVVNDAGSSSLFSMQPGLSVQKAEDELMELRKAATSNLLRKSSPELLDRGMLGMSDASMGSRRKSFADIVQEGLGQPATITGHVSRPVSRNSLNDNLVRAGISITDSAELQKKAATGEVLHPRQMVPGLSGVQNIGSSLAESFSSPLHSPSTRSRTPDPHLIGRTPSPGLRNADFGVGLGDGVNVSGSNSLSGFSSGVTEIANVAASLAGLNMSKDQFLNKDNRLHSQLQFLDKSRAENLATATNYTNLMRENGVVPPNLNNSSLGLNGQNFPRRTYSSASLHSQVNHRGFASPADRNSYDNVCNNHPATGLASPSASLNGRSLRKNVGQTGSNLHTTLMDPRHAHHLHESYHQKMNAGLLPGNPSQTRNCIRNSHGLEDLEDFGRMYLETLLAQQKQQYQSSGLQHRYNGNPALDLCMPYQGNQMAKSAHPTVGSGTAMCHNERMPRVPSMLNNSIGTGSWHPETETNMEGRLASTLLEELKNSPTRPLELSDVLGHVVEFSKDQNGSRFIQQKLETATVEEKMKIFPEIIPHARGLMTDVFGNYVIQKFFKHGMESHRKELASQLIGHVLPLSLQMYGCRVIQKALEVVEVEQQTQMVAELDGSVLKCVRDQNGNHVIQKCIECVPQDRIHFIISSVFGQVVALSMHPYGCRVIQRVLEHCDDPKTQKIIMDEIMHSICTLAQDQYGNYVIQHVLQHGKPHERSVIISKLAGQIVKMSQQKFASNVVEKCLTFGSPEECQLLVNEMLGSTDENEPLQAMMKDPFGNYVVQKVLETCDDQSREYILSRIKVHLNALKKYTYGKHIVSRVEKLITTGERHKDSSRFAS